MSQGNQPTASTVLVLEADFSLRRLIALGLRHQQLLVLEISSLDAVPTTDIENLDLLVLDVDKGFTCNWSLVELVQRHPQLACLPTIVLSWEPAAAPVPAGIICLSKPFDARALHEKIHELLEVRTSEKVAQIAQAEAALLASFEHRTSPTIWPVITAAGLLLAVIGLLLQLALVIVGVLIVIAGLLLWTLGSQSRVMTREVAFGVGKQ